MGSQFFNVGEKKERPGVYKRYENSGLTDVPSAMYGVFAIPVHAALGPLETVTSFEKDQIDELKAMYGTEGTVNAALALFDGGATKVYIYRLGSNGSEETVDLSDSGSASTKLVTLTTKYVTAKALSVTIKDKLGATSTKQLLLYSGTDLLETIEYETGETDSTALVNAVKANSAYLNAKKEADGKVADVSNKALSGGEEPTVTTESYSAAFEAFEAFKWNVLVLDTVDTDVHALVKSYIDRIFQDGSYGVCILGETKPSFDNRLANAASFNDEKIIYLGSGYVDSNGDEVTGYLAIAKQAGIIGSLSSNESVTHTVIPGAVNTTEQLKNAKYVEAIKKGMLLLSTNDEGQVWFDSGVNTLITPNKNQDDGWKKIRRTSIRFEIFDRIDRALAPLIGKVDCDDIGIGDAVMRGQSVLDAMASEDERKLNAGPIFEEDTTKSRGSDYAFFRIACDDKDSLEKIYLTYQFRFTAE